MRTISLLLILISTFFSSFFLSGQPEVQASERCWFTFGQENCGQTDVPYCKNGNCSLESGVDSTANAIKGSGINTDTRDGALVSYIQAIVLYFLGFVSLIAVIYILYAGFQVMTSAGDEEKTKNAKKIILHVAIGIIIMWLAYAFVSWVITLVSREGSNKSAGLNHSWSMLPEVSAAYTESDIDTFREYQNQLRTAIQKLESELKVNKVVSTANLQNIKNLVQNAYDRLPDFGEVGSQNETMKLAVDRDIDIAIKNPNSTSQVGTAISSVSSFLSNAKIESVQGSINATPGEGNVPLTVSFEASNIKDPSGATPDQMSYIWWMRENGGVRRELGRGKSLIYTFNQEGSYTVFLDVISGSRNSKKKIDVLPLTASKTIEVKPRLGEIVLLVNGVNVSNLQNIKINPTIGKMGIILDATASRATGGNITETKWEFGNGNSMNYRGSPIVERQIFSNEGDYSVRLTLVTNNGQTFTKEVRLIVRNPAAVIQTEKVVGNVGDDMFFSSLSYFTNTQNVEYAWQIQDDNNKKIASNIPGKTLKYKFDKIGNYIITLTARSPNGEVDTDSRQITIESRSPIVNLDAPKSFSTEMPNTIIFDASKSYDPDTMGKKGLTYTWKIDGVKVALEDTTTDGAKGTLKFDTTGTHNVSLTVANNYGKVTTVERTFEVTSLLSANILISPRVAPIGTIVNFIAQSEYADFYEWNMGDGSPVQTGNKKIVQHIYQKTGVYDITLTVSSARGTETNQIRRRVFVTDTNAPFSMINISNGSSTAFYDKDACGGSGAMVINRSEVTTFDGSKSINIDGGTADLSYTWNYLGKVKTVPTLTEKMGDIGCYPIKLTVRSNKNGATHTSTEYIAIQNQVPNLTSISTSIDTSKKDSQKVLVKVQANGVSDPDGVVTSYIWYYTTESDKEPQNVQITQKPEITFVLPNITEKYYFGVILEDNNGAKTNSMIEGSEQVPLILDNQNGNIYMPLISLSMPKNAVLVGESVHISAEAKTIVGTNITKNAEYSWDFDGDGKFEEKGNNPSVNYVFKNSGTYPMKVRVTYNGVSNTKYGTIYVKNPLKADATGYELQNGDIYILNSSEGLYDRVIWTIDGEQVESFSSLTIPREEVPSGDDIGTIQVSNGTTDTSSYTLKKNTLIKIASGSSINYQSSPRATNDTIHIKGQSDKLMLSMVGNTATSYKIDTDIRIDSDLDGTPDNDTDNKDHPSYTDGTIFSINDLGESRVHERTIRITLISNGQIIGTKDITIILDFIPESGSVSGEDVLLSTSDTISTFDRTKLEELANMIRTTESTDRIILMKKYNLMIENWGDTFSKAKSLIDIQEAIDTTSLSDDKKIAMSELIDTLLVGDATATDEITLASKLIEGLIPESSQNRKTILEKLGTISSHPGNIEENKKLGKEILELVKNDATIEDKYKIHIKNQLLIIINGGQASIPSGEIEESTVSGSGIWGFISGVVWIFFYIIGGIILVLILGYVFYFVSRKNPDIGFQDFLIDSVFHAKKNDTSGTTSPIVTNSAGFGAGKSNPETQSLDSTTIELPKGDPLSSYIPPTPVLDQKIESSPSVSMDPLMEQQSAIPSWLQIPKTETKTTLPNVEISTSKDSSNMDDSIYTTTTETTAATTVKFNNAPTGIPLGSPMDTNTVPYQDQEDTKIASEDTVITETHQDIPSWLKMTTPEVTNNLDPLAPIESSNNESIGLDSIIQEDQAVISDVLVPMSENTSNDLPDWLVDSLKKDTQNPVSGIDTVPEEEKITTNPPKKTRKTQKNKEDTGVIQNEGAQSIPDWLK